VLKPREWRFASKNLIDELRAVMTVPGINLSFTQPIEMRVSEMLSGVRGDLAIKVFGPGRRAGPAGRPDRAGGAGRARREDVITAPERGRAVPAVNIDRAAAGRLGLNVEQVQNDLRALLEGRRAAP
jgi:cobalt-zinc-cadmium resistance protein CzcA